MANARNSQALSNTTVWTALVTPFTKEKTLLDLNAMHKILHTQNQAGNGILLCGSTGEGPLLSNMEKMRVLKACFKNDLNVPVMGTLPNINLLDTLEWTAKYNDSPVAACLLSTPVYTKPGVKGQIQWFEKILNTLKKPLMVYNIPSRTGVQLYTEVLQALDGHPNLWAIKDSSGNTNNLERYIELGLKIQVFAGDDGILKDMAKTKHVKGLVSVMANAWPFATKLYVEKHLAGLSVTDEEMWQEAIKSLFITSNPVPIKNLMAEMGLISTNEVRPPLSILDMPANNKLREYYKKIAAWYRVNNG